MRHQTAHSNERFSYAYYPYQLGRAIRLRVALQRHDSRSNLVWRLFGFGASQGQSEAVARQYRAESLSPWISGEVTGEVA